MMTLRVSSVQSYTCTDSYVSDLICSPSAPAREVAEPVTAFTGGDAGVSHRALQSLRQGWLPLCGRQGAWSQILPVGELPGRTPTDGLRTAGVRAPGARAPEQPAAGARDPGADLRDQSRAITSARGALNGRGERQGRAHTSLRSSRCDLAACEHAGELDRGAIESNPVGGRP